MGLTPTLKFIVSHPLNRSNKAAALFRFFKWQVISRLNNDPVNCRFAGKSMLAVKKGMTGATGNIYCGLHEFEDMSFLLHFLRETDLFVDVGANIGSYTILASSEAGASTIAIEPVPDTFKFLVENIALNKVSGKVTACNIALGSSKGQVNFTKSLDTVNHVATSGETEVVSVPVDSLDDVLNGKVPALLKIDVEGFETEVLKGGVSTLSQMGLHAIIIELNGSGLRYGYDEDKIHQQLTEAGFLPYSYEPFTRQLHKVEERGYLNTIYLRDVAAVSERLKKADKIRIFDSAY